MPNLAESAARYKSELEPTTRASYGTLASSLKNEAAAGITQHH